jgi:hypothetical protein
LKTIHVILSLVLLAGLVLVGCSQTTATVDTGSMETSIAGTLAVMQTKDAETNLAAATKAVEQPTEMPTLEATATMEAVAVATETATAAPTISVAVTEEALGPSYRVGHVTDLNFKDGSFVDIRLKFTKRWEVTNVGTATWPADTKLVPVDDNPFGAPDYVYIGQVVSPGQKVKLAVELRCPEVAATYTGHFMLETPDGKRFGIGPNFDEPFWVKIVCHA